MAGRRVWPAHCHQCMTVPTPRARRNHAHTHPARPPDAALGSAASAHLHAAAARAAMQPTQAIAPLASVSPAVWA